MPTTHKVQSGECLLSIATEHGFHDWEAVWNHEQNASLRSERPNPSVLQEGDELFIPDVGDRWETCETGREHVFQLKPPPQTTVHLVLEQYPGVPYAETPFELQVELKDGSPDPDSPYSGYTSREGELRVAVSPLALKGRLALSLEEGKREYDLQIGDLDPITTVSGVQDRLRNLGYDLGDEDGEVGERTESALRAFQRAHELPESGEIDDATREQVQLASGH